MGIVVREVRVSDRAALLSIIERSPNITEEEKDCALELLDIYLSDLPGEGPLGGSGDEGGEGMLKDGPESGGVGDNGLAEEKEYVFHAAATEGGRIAGFVCFGPASLAINVTDIYWVLVDPDMQRQGVGRTLLAHTEALLKGQGVRKLVIETSSTPGYDGARSFYLDCGFKEEARLSDFFKPGDDKVFYVKDC